MGIGMSVKVPLQLTPREISLSWNLDLEVCLRGRVNWSKLERRHCIAGMKWRVWSANLTALSFNVECYMLTVGRLGGRFVHVAEIVSMSMSMNIDPCLLFPFFFADFP